MFDWLRQHRPDALEKLKPVCGDVSLPNLGIEASILEELEGNVSVVFNSAARVKFDDNLRSAIDANVKGPRSVATFCRKLKNLEVVLICYMQSFFHAPVVWYCYCESTPLTDISSLFLHTGFCSRFDCV